MVAYVFHILKMNIIAAVIIMLVTAISRLTKGKYSLKWKYYMWLIISVFLLVPVNFSARSPVRLQIGGPADQRRSVSGVPAMRGDGSPAAAMGKIAGGQSISAQQRDTAEGKTPGGQSAAAVQSASAQSDTYIPVQFSSSAISIYGFLEAFGVIWTVGIFFAAVTKILRYHFSLHRMIRWSYPVEDKRTVELYRWICMKKHIKHPPVLLISPELSSPVLAGLRRTGLYLTEEEYSPEEIKFILSHELSHYKNGDLWYKMLLMAVSTVYWFNPALYWMRNEAEKDIENLCDSRVVEHYTGEEKMKYSRLLLKTAAFQNHVPYLAASLNDSTLVFKERILYMKNLRHLKKNVLGAAALTAVMVSAQFLVGSAVNENGVSPDTALPSAVSGIVKDTGVNGTGISKSASPGGADVSGASAPSGADVSGASVSGGAGISGNGVSQNGILNGNGTTGGAELNGNGGSGDNTPGEDAVSVNNSPDGTALDEEADGAADFAYSNTSETVQRTVESTDFTAWVAGQQLNIRSDASVDGAVLGSASFMDAVEVIGIVQENGAANGWYQVNYNGTVGYIAAEYTTTEPYTAETLGYTLTDQQVTLYTGDGSSAAYVYKATDGSWYDGSGRQYQPDGTGLWTCLSSGGIWTETAPQTPDTASQPSGAQAVNQAEVIDGDGYNSQTLYLTDGVWQNIAGGIYTAGGDGTWTGPDGEVWYGN